MSRPSAVVISPEAPYPMHGGGAIRTASLLHYRLRRYDVDLILFRQEGDSDPALSLPLATPLARRVRTITLPFHSRRRLHWLLRNGRRWITGAPPLLNRFSGQGHEVAAFVSGCSYDVGLIEHFWCAPYLEQLAPVCRRTFLDLHNIESELHGSCARSGSWPLSVAHSRFERAYVEEEKRWLPRFSGLLCTSEEDAVRLRNLAPDTMATVYRNSLPLVPVPNTSEEPAIAFSGNFESPEYCSGAISGQRYLADSCRSVSQPQAKDDRQESRRRGALRQWIAQDRDTGPVEDAIAELAKAEVAVVPLLSGSGTR